ncbi:DUF3597 family protein [Siminovitchia sp. FSL H7-0308]|uniref:DUF3597 family protein n=1 Tax=Siminovitchia sp. FSL H7-0308 TaxID=2921432 RepID=UPI0030ED23B3
MVPIKRQLVSKDIINKRTYGTGNPCNYITIHETANENIGAGAQTHANLQANLNPRDASWHYQVDDKEVIQSFPDHIQCWAAGDGKGPGNTQSIHIEICVNKDGDFKKAVSNAAELVNMLMATYEIAISNIVQHNRWSGKDCPHYLSNGNKGISWSDFISMIKGGESVPKPAPKPGGYKGNSIVDYLNSIGMDASFANRAKLAAQHGIPNYKGTADQNLKLLNTLRSGGTPPTTPEQPQGNQKTNSIVDYLKSIGVDSSFANRAKLAAQHGISNYKGTADQNLKLLNTLRSGGTPPTTPEQPQGNQKTNSIVDYLKSIGVDSSFANRKKLAEQHGIHNYTGTAEQNLLLLKKLRD